ncbi:hypothetical protein L6452_18373 [Arctium lappa]|uniref:Uncharacterized protein n=1 Tax=Arctium lappa TaxID=4217 RepID=A0ACB9C603_ARCLA|nr:hypothetical protein L6452_18373 [Arctium lappa]
MILPSCNNCTIIVVFRGWLFVYANGLDSKAGLFRLDCRKSEIRGGLSLQTRASFSFGCIFVSGNLFPYS